MKEHWERVYQNNPIDRLGWYESGSESSLNLIELCKLSQDAYFNLLRTPVSQKGYVNIAAFNLKGAPKCSELPVFRYNAPMLQEKLGEEFQLKEAFDYTYTQPSGDTREYVYTLFQRKQGVVI